MNVKVLTHQVSRKIGRSKDEKIVSTHIGLAPESEAKAVAKAMNSANGGKGMYKDGSVTVTDLPFYAKADVFVAEQAAKEQAAKDEQAEAAKKKLSKLTDAQLSALADNLGVDVADLKAATTEAKADKAEADTEAA